MSFTEPYTIVTSWPETNEYSVGTKLCYHSILTLEQVKENLEEPINNMICTHMIEHNYKRVTISQIISLESIGGTLVWIPMGYPRVPDKSYYCKY